MTGQQKIRLTRTPCRLKSPPPPGETSFEDREVDESRRRGWVRRSREESVLLGSPDRPSDEFHEQTAKQPRAASARSLKIGLYA